MTDVLLLSLPLFWLLLLCSITRKALSVLLIWLVLAPVVSNIVNRRNANPLYRTPAEASAVASRDPRRGGYFLAPQDPIRLNQLLEPTRTLFVSILLVFLLGTVIGKRRFTLNQTEIWMGVFSFILLFGVVFKSNRLHYSMRVASDAFIIGFSAYFIARRLITTESDFRKLVRAIGYAAVIIIVLCLMERITHGALLYRIGGPFRSTGILYIVMMVAFFVVLLDQLPGAGFAEGTRALRAGVARFVLCSVPVVILLTWARSNYLGFLAGIAVVVFLGRRLIGRSLGKIIGVLLIFIAVAVMIGPELASNVIIERRMGDSVTIYGRIATWMVTIEQGMRNPVFGIGLNNMRNVLSENVAHFNSFDSWVSVHNSFLEILAEQGLAGLIFYLAIVTSIVRMGLKIYNNGMRSSDQWRGIAVVAVTIAYLVPSLFASVLHEADPMQSVFVYTFLGAIAGLHDCKSRSQVDTCSAIDQRLTNVRAMQPRSSSARSPVSARASGNYTE